MAGAGIGVAALDQWGPVIAGGVMGGMLMALVRRPKTWREGASLAAGGLLSAMLFHRAFAALARSSGWESVTTLEGAGLAGVLGLVVVKGFLVVVEQLDFTLWLPAWMRRKPLETEETE